MFGFPPVMCGLDKSPGWAVSAPWAIALYLTEVLLSSPGYIPKSPSVSHCGTGNPTPHLLLVAGGSWQSYLVDRGLSV